MCCLCFESVNLDFSAIKEKPNIVLFCFFLLHYTFTSCIILFSFRFFFLPGVKGLDNPICFSCKWLAFISSCRQGIVWKGCSLDPWRSRRRQPAVLLARGTGALPGRGGAAGMERLPWDLLSSPPLSARQS